MKMPAILQQTWSSLLQHSIINTILLTTKTTSITTLLHEDISKLLHSYLFTVTFTCAIICLLLLASTVREDTVTGMANIS